VRVTKEDLLHRMSSDERDERDEAQTFLLTELAGGPMPVNGLKKAAHAVGITDSALKTAKSKLRVKAQRVGGAAGAGHWEWELPKGTAKGLSPNVAPLSALSPVSASKEVKKTKGGFYRMRSLARPLARTGSRRQSRRPSCTGWPRSSGVPRDGGDGEGGDGPEGGDLPYFFQPCRQGRKK
jgi:hypothetical protein